MLMGVAAEAVAAELDEVAAEVPGSPAASGLSSWAAALRRGARPDRSEARSLLRRHAPQAARPRKPIRCLSAVERRQAVLPLAPPNLRLCSAPPGHSRCTKR